MTLNAAGDLDRFAYKTGAHAHCALMGCDFRVEGQSSETTGTKARAHTRETGHTTRVYHDHTTVYRQPHGAKS